MSTETVSRFETEIRKVVEYFKEEFDMSYGEAIGTLEIVKHDLLTDADD